MGYVMPILPLWKAVMENARNAAFRDQRFSPLTREETGSSAIEISALTVPRRIADFSEFIIGTDGLILRKDFRQAVLMPQSAARNGWDASGIRMYLGNSVGLEPNGWDRADSLETFQAESFKGDVNVL